MSGSGCEGPSSAAGAVLSVIYVLLGLPLMILYLLRIGRLLANLVTCLCCTAQDRRYVEIPSRYPVDIPTPFTASQTYPTYQNLISFMLR